MALHLCRTFRFPSLKAHRLVITDPAVEEWRRPPARLAARNDEQTRGTGSLPPDALRAVPEGEKATE